MFIVVWLLLDTCVTVSITAGVTVLTFRFYTVHCCRPALHLTLFYLHWLSSSFYFALCLLLPALIRSAQWVVGSIRIVFIFLMWGSCLAQVCCCLINQKWTPLASSENTVTVVLPWGSPCVFTSNCTDTFQKRYYACLVSGKKKLFNNYNRSYIGIAVPDAVIENVISSFRPIRIQPCRVFSLLLLFTAGGARELTASAPPWLR